MKHFFTTEETRLSLLTSRILLFSFHRSFVLSLHHTQNSLLKTHYFFPWFLATFNHFLQSSNHSIIIHSYLSERAGF
ncbi:MAG: hypothetical protein V5A47_05015, partial [Bacteroidales bacterium]